MNENRQKSCRFFLHKKRTSYEITCPYQKQKYNLIVTNDCSKIIIHSLLSLKTLIMKLKNSDINKTE